MSESFFYQHCHVVVTLAEVTFGSGNGPMRWTRMPGSPNPTPASSRASSRWLTPPARPGRASPGPRGCAPRATTRHTVGRRRIGPAEPGAGALPATGRPMQHRTPHPLQAGAVLLVPSPHALPALAYNTRLDWATCRAYMAWPARPDAPPQSGWAFNFAPWFLPQLFAGFSLDSPQFAVQHAMTIARTEDIIADIRAGRMVILVDEEDRENEGDLVLAADFVTPEAINFMAKYGRGLICLTLTAERCRQLELYPMVSRNGTVHGTELHGVDRGRRRRDHRHLRRRPLAHRAGCRGPRRQGRAIWCSPATSSR